MGAILTCCQWQLAVGGSGIPGVYTHSLDVARKVKPDTIMNAFVVVRTVRDDWASARVMQLPNTLCPCHHKATPLHPPSHGSHGRWQRRRWEGGQVCSFGHSHSASRTWTGRLQPSPAGTLGTKNTGPQPRPRLAWPSANPGHTTACRGPPDPTTFTLCSLTVCFTVIYML